MASKKAKKRNRKKRGWDSDVSDLVAELFGEMSDSSDAHYLNSSDYHADDHATMRLAQ